MNTMDIFFYISSVVTFAQYVDKVLRPPPAVPVRIKKKKKTYCSIFVACEYYSVVACDLSECVCT